MAFSEPLQDEREEERQELVEARAQALAASVRRLVANGVAPFEDFDREKIERRLGELLGPLSDTRCMMRGMKDSRDLFCPGCGKPLYGLLCCGCEVGRRERAALESAAGKRCDTVAASGGSEPNSLDSVSQCGALTLAPTASMRSPYFDMLDEVKAAILEDENYLRKLARKLVETPE